MKRIVMLLLVPLLFVGCQQSKELTPDEKEAIAKEFKQISLGYWELNKDFSSENYEEMKTYFDKSFEAYWQTEPAVAVLNTTVIDGYDKAMQNLDEINEERASLDYTITQHGISVLSKDMVLEVLSMDYRIINRDGTIYEPLEIVFTNVWHKAEGKWKFFHTHQTFRRKVVKDK